MQHNSAQFLSLHFHCSKIHQTNAVKTCKNHTFMQTLCHRPCPTSFFPPLPLPLFSGGFTGPPAPRSPYFPGAHPTGLVTQPCFWGLHWGLCWVGATQSALAHSAAPLHTPLRRQERRKLTLDTIIRVWARKTVHSRSPCGGAA